MPSRSFALPFPAGQLGALGSNFPFHDPRRVELQVLFVFPPAQFDPLAPIEQGVTHRDRFKLGNLQKENVVAAGQPALLVEPLAEDQENAAHEGEPPDAEVLQLLPKDSQFLRTAQRAQEDPAFDGIPQPLAALDGQAFPFFSQPPLLFQRIGLAQRTEITAHQPQNVIRGLAPAGVGQFEFSAAMVPVLAHKGIPVGQELPAMFGAAKPGADLRPTVFGRHNSLCVLGRLEPALPGAREPSRLPQPACRPVRKTSEEPGQNPPANRGRLSEKPAARLPGSPSRKYPFS